MIGNITTSIDFIVGGTNVVQAINGYKQVIFITTFA